MEEWFNQFYQREFPLEGNARVVVDEVLMPFGGKAENVVERNGIVSVVAKVPCTPVFENGEMVYVRQVVMAELPQEPLDTHNMRHLGTLEIDGVPRRFFA